MAQSLRARHCVALLNLPRSCGARLRRVGTEGRLNIHGPLCLSPVAQNYLIRQGIVMLYAYRALDALPIMLCSTGFVVSEVMTSGIGEARREAVRTRQTLCDARSPIASGQFQPQNL